MKTSLRSIAGTRGGRAVALVVAIVLAASAWALWPFSRERASGDEPTSGALRVEVVLDSDRYRLRTIDRQVISRSEAAMPLTVRLTNVSQDRLHVAYPSECYSLKVELKGPGTSTHVDLVQDELVRGVFMPPLRGEVHELKPGESFDIHLSRLYVFNRGQATQWFGYISRPGTIQVRASYRAECSDNLLSFVKGTSDPVTAYVVEQ